MRRILHRFALAQVGEPCDYHEEPRIDLCGPGGCGLYPRECVLTVEVNGGCWVIPATELRAALESTKGMP